MIDLKNLEQYRENNRIEAKRSLGGLPQSIWETYSSFANTMGGIILLGVEEWPDKSLHPVNLPAPEALIEEFWEILNDPQRTSINILTKDQIQIEEIEGNRVIAITVPRAQRYDKPVYLDGNPFLSYRRNGDGDYKCSKEDVKSMLRDAARQTQDMLLLDGMGLTVLDSGSISRYRAGLENCRPGSLWTQLEEEEFLYRIGAVGRGESGDLHPTAAGLLMFGREYEIVREFPNYFLDYREQEGDPLSMVYRITSPSGDWSGNLYDFYCLVQERIQSWPVLAEALEVRRAYEEALVNCLTNGDYYGRQGLWIVRSRREMSFSNPGSFRVDVKTAIQGGVPDPRNGGLVKMFHLIGVSERTGSGLSHIYHLWQERGWKTPHMQEEFQPDRITFTMSMEQEKSGRQSAGLKGAWLGNFHREMIISYLTDHVYGKIGEMAKANHMSRASVKGVLEELERQDIVQVTGRGRSQIYRLKG